MRDIIINVSDGNQSWHLWTRTDDIAAAMKDALDDARDEYADTVEVDGEHMGPITLGADAYAGRIGGMTQDKEDMGPAPVDDEEDEWLGGESLDIEPIIPDCTERMNGVHEWRSAHEVVGGLEENPGVWGNGGGVVIKEHCRHCGILRNRDTWDQSWSGTGEPCETVSLESPTEASEAYAAVGWQVDDDSHDLDGAVLCPECADGWQGLDDLHEVHNWAHDDVEQCAHCACHDIETEVPTTYIDPAS